MRSRRSGGSILGITIGKHFLGLEALANISDSQLEETVRPWLASTIGGEA